MGESATAVDVAQQTESNVTYGLGRLGWILWGLMVAMNFFGGMSAFSGATVAGYAIFCLVGSYVWMRVLKAVLKFLNIL